MNKSPAFYRLIKVIFNFFYFIMSFFFLHLIWFPGNDKFFYLVSPPLSCYKLVLNLEPVAGILLITIVNKTK